ncbi:uncharacterized protein VTP21DRAFT_4484 [Calcarisporiella thermophila]|uniref:uncharacterized protein n=1 Tax=Calcarisporiella thermophila TaxID=911321 RepID=UPI00374314EA
MHFRIKHAYLINNCYPKASNEKGPKPSELSYLTFYASSRPAKLTKVGKYLERKVKRDVAKNRVQDNQVSLDIMKALVEECKRDLNLFSKNIVAIIDDIIDTRELDTLVPRACDLFVLFTKYNNGAVLGMDTELTGAYIRLIEKFSKFATNKSSDSTIRIKGRFIGLKALHAVASSDPLFSSDAAAELEPILLAVFTNLLDAEGKLTELQKRNSESMLVPDNIVDPESQIEDIQLLSLQVLTMLLRKSNAVDIIRSLEPITKFLDKNEKWWPPNFAIELMQVFATGLQPQYRYMLVSDILRRLDTSFDRKITERNASLVSILASMLTSDYNFVGLSVLEVLNSLLHNFIESLKGTKFREEPVEEKKSLSMEYSIHQGLVKSIGGLAGQIYYSNQVNDVISHIISKLRANTTLEEVDGVPIGQLRRALLRCLQVIITTNQEALLSSQEDETTFRLPFALDIWTPTVSLCTDSDYSTRLIYSETLLMLLNSHRIKSGLLTDQYFTSTKDRQFRLTLHTQLIAYAMISSSKPADFAAIRLILRELLENFEEDEAVKCVPLLFKLQNICVEERLIGNVRQRVLSTIILQHMLLIANVLDSQELKSYLEEAQKQRMSDNQWIDFYEDVSSSQLRTLPSSFESVESADQPPVTHWISREALVRAIMRDSRVRDEEEVEEALSQEFGVREVGIWRKQDFRIRSSFVAAGIDLRNRSPLPLDTPRNSSIKVENLREALETGVESPRREGYEENQEAPQQPKGPRKSEVGRLLDLISVQNEGEGTSLINPPYRTA